MNSEQVLAEIREANFSYLTLAQTLLRADREVAKQQLGIDDHSAELIEAMNPMQIAKVASGNTLLCRLGVGEELVWDLITSTGRFSSHAPASRDASAAASRPRLGA